MTVALERAYLITRILTPSQEAGPGDRFHIQTGFGFRFDDFSHGSSHQNGGGVINFDDLNALVFLIFIIARYNDC